MKTYDVECPICGKLNRNLYLEETDGWMECECCKSTVRKEKGPRNIILPIVGLCEMKETVPAT